MWDTYNASVVQILSKTLSFDNIAMLEVGPKDLFEGVGSGLSHLTFHWDFQFYTTYESYGGWSLMETDPLWNPLLVGSG